MEREFFVFANSNDSTDHYPENRTEDFVIHLAKPVHLEGQWECGLMQYQFNSTVDKPFYVCCDLVQESFVGDHKQSVLRRIRLKNVQFANVIYLPLKVHDFNSIRVYLRSWKDKEPRGIKGQSFCTLHFRRVK